MTFRKIFIAVLDVSLSMDERFENTTRRAAAVEATWNAVQTLRSALAADIGFAQIIFERSAECVVPLTSVLNVRREQLAYMPFCFIKRTNFMAPLRECERLLWPGPAQSLVTHGLDIGQRLRTLFTSLAPEPDPLPKSSIPVEMQLITDGEHNGWASEDDCVQQAQRLKDAGLRISANGIGDPAKFGLLKRLVSNDSDYCVHQTPASLDRTVEQGALRLIQDE